MARKTGAQIGAAEPDLFSGKVPLPVIKLRSAEEVPPPPMPSSKAVQAFKTISETAKMLSLPQHVLRFWESKFAQIRPLKLRGGRRYYRPQDIDALLAIKHLLYKEGYTIKGARRAFVQVKKQKKDSNMPEDMGRKSKRKADAPLEETPLFRSLLMPQAKTEEHATEKATAPAKKDELRRIHDELLEMRDLLSALPPLTVP